MSIVDDQKRCQWCDNFHRGFCPRVKAIEYEHGGLSIKRVEFFAPNDYPPIKVEAK